VLHARKCPNRGKAITLLHRKALREKLFIISSFEESINRGMSLVGVMRVGLPVPSDDVGGKYKHFSFAHD